MDRPRIRVLCVDDSTLFTSAWERLLSRQADMECADPWTVRMNSCRSRDSRADVVLLDLTDWRRDPLEALVELKSTCPEIKVVVCSGYSDRGRELAAKAVHRGMWTKLISPAAFWRRCVGSPRLAG